MAEGDVLFLRDMAVVLGVAAIATILFYRLKQPVVLGYLLAGFIVGPHTPPILGVREVGTIEVLGEVGLVFLLFGIGLEFHLGKLRKVGVTALVAGPLEASLMVWLGYTLGRAFGLGAEAALYLGAVMCISSTVIIAKVLEETGKQDEPWAQIVLGILVVEDILAVLILTFLATDIGLGTGAVLANVGAVALRLALFLVAALVLGLVVVPRVVAWVARLRVGEVLVVTVVALAFGLAVLGAFLGFSVALGAFLMGALIAESQAAKLVERRLFPIRDLFTAVFFVTIGMLVDPAAILANWGLVLAVTLAVIAGKITAVTFATFVGGHDVGTSLRVGFGLAQIGEFSFVIAALAAERGLTDAPLFAVAVGVAAITSFTTPILVRAAPRAVHAVERFAPRPILTYARLYGSWVARLRADRIGRPAWRKVLLSGVRAGILGAVTVAVFVAGAASVDTVGAFLGTGRVPRAAFDLLGWSAIALVTAAVGALAWRALRAFVVALSDAALPENMRASPTGLVVRRVLRRTFVFTALLLAAAFVLVLGSTFGPSPAVLVVLGLVVGTSAVLLGDALVRFQRRVDAVVGEVVGEEADGGEEREDVLRLIRETYPLAVDVDEVPVPQGSWAVGRPIRDVGLRARTGASVVAVDRSGVRHLNPPADWRILPGDVLLVLGEAGQTAVARGILESPDAPPSDEGIRVAPASELVGATLAGARIRERTGATVVGVLRGGERFENPAPAFAFEAGDRLLALGDKGQVDALRALAEDRASRVDPSERPDA